MKYAIFTIGILVALIVMYMIFAEQEYDHAEPWPPEIKTFVNPLTSRVRVVDSTDNTTLFFYHIDALAKPVAFEKQNNQWIIRFDKRGIHEASGLK